MIRGCLLLLYFVVHVEVSRASGGFAEFSPSMSAKDYAFSRVQAPAPLRAGKFSQRFELRDGDCGSDGIGWDDCRSDRGRVEMVSAERFQPGQDKWIAWSVFIPEDFVDVFPAKTTLGQIHQIGGAEGVINSLPSEPPLLQFELSAGNYVLSHHRASGHGEALKDATKSTVLIPLARMRGKWTDVVLHVNFSRGKGFAAVFINGVRRATVGKNLVAGTPDSFYFKYGIYNAFISRYRANHPRMPTQVVYFDEVRLGDRRSDVDSRANPKLAPVD